MNQLSFDRFLRICCLLAGVSLPVWCNTGSCASAADQQTSALWGSRGEQWDPQGRLPDFSFAGYHRGERSLPDQPADISIREFGAVGDGTTDDTAAFQRAVMEAAGKVIAIPAGRYVITDFIDIRHSGTVLRGVGPEQSVIVVPKPLEEIRSNMGATTGGRPTSNYSWSGGIFRARGTWEQKELAKVTAPALRGHATLFVDRCDSLAVGDEVRLEMRDDADKTFSVHVYNNDPGDIGKLKKSRALWIARVVEIDAAKQSIRLDRALRTDVRPEWTPGLFPARSTVEEIGIENLAFEFPVTPYLGHFTEAGYNAIAFSNVRNSWVRNVEIRHADSGLFVSGANSTITNIVWKSDRKRDTGRNSTGHHGITLSGTDLLLCEFDLQTKFIHDITMSRGSAGNVVLNGKGEDITFDHHKYANHSNLFCNIDAGEGTNIFRSGGGAKLGRHCGAWSTWWNIRTVRPVKLPPGWSPEMINIVGVVSDSQTVTEVGGRWFEVIAPEELRPANLYESQLTRRLGETEAASSQD